MTQIKRIEKKDVRVELLCEYGKMEFGRQTLEGEEFYEVTREDPLLVFGIRKGSLLGTPELWLFLYSTYQPFHLRWSRKALSVLLMKHHALQVWVRVDFPKGLKFARKHGFTFARRFTHEGIEYENLVVRAK